VRFRETCLAVVVVVARVRDEVLYTFFAAPLTPLHSFQTLVLANVRQAPHPLCCPLSGTLLLAAAWPLVGIREDSVEDPRLRHWVHSTAAWPLSGAHRCLPLHFHLTGTRADLVVAPLRVPVLLDPGCAWSFAAWPLAGAHRRLFLHASSTLFSRKVLCLSIRKEERGNIWDGGGSNQCRRGLANTDRFVSWCTGNGYLL
jgi:hypothetical protein